MYFQRLFFVGILLTSISVGIDGHDALQKPLADLRRALAAEDVTALRSAIRSLHELSDESVIYATTHRTHIEVRLSPKNVRLDQLLSGVSGSPGALCYGFGYSGGLIRRTGLRMLRDGKKFMTIEFNGDALIVHVGGAGTLGKDCAKYCATEYLLSLLYSHVAAEFVDIGIKPH